MKPVSIKPTDGGKLLSDLSAGSVGIANYVTKRDWRRHLEREIRAEGYVRFRPNPTVPDAEQYRPSGATGEITVIAEAKLASGMVVAVVGTPTTLYQYFGLKDGAYYEPGVVEDGYFNDNPGEWLVVGSGFSEAGARWEAVNVGSWLVLNNGYDLPMTFRCGDLAVEPIHELREQGIASVGTIAENNGMLVCMDLRQIKIAKHAEIMTPTAAARMAQLSGAETSLTARAKINSGVDGVAGNSITATASDFNGGLGFLGMEGKTIRMANGLTRIIASVTSATQAVMGGAATICEPLQPFNIIGVNDKRVTPDLATLFPSVVSSVVGLKLFWESGEVAEIRSVAGGYIFVDTDRPIAPGRVSLENPDAYAAFSNAASIDRYQARATYSMPNLPRRWGATIPCFVDYGSSVVRLKYPVRSLKPGMSITVVGDSNGANLTADVLWATPNSVVLKDAAVAAANTVIQDSVAALTQAKSDRLANKNSTASTLAVASEALAKAAASASAAPTDTDLKTAEANASAAVDAARAAADAAATAYDDAVAALDEALSLIGTKTPVWGTNMAAGVYVDGVWSPEFWVTGFEIGKRYRYTKGSETYFATAVFFNPLIPPTFIEEGEFVATQTRYVLVKNLGTGQATDASVQPQSSDTYVFETELVAADAESSIAGLYDDLEGDGSAIIRALTLKGYLMVYKEGAPFFLGRYTGNSTKPFQWAPIEVKADEALPARHKHTLEQISDGLHVYAGEADFFTFDVANRQPQLLQLLKPVSRAFFSAPGKKFTANNSITREMWFCFPGGKTDKALCYDYQYNTVRTTTTTLTAGEVINKPEATNASSRALWFVMGIDGTLMRYGRTLSDEINSGEIVATKTSQTVVAASAIFDPSHIGRTIRFSGGKLFAITDYNSPTSVVVLGSGSVTGETFTIIPAVWHRDGAEYISLLESGCDNFGSSHVEKLLNEYVLMPSSDSPDTAVIIMFRGGVSPQQAADIQGATIDSPQRRGLLKPTVLQYFIGDRLTISGINNPFELSERIFGFVPLASQSFQRRGNGT